MAPEFPFTNSQPITLTLFDHQLCFSLSRLRQILLSSSWLSSNSARRDWFDTPCYDFILLALYYYCGSLIFVSSPDIYDCTSCCHDRLLLLLIKVFSSSPRHLVTLFCSPSSCSFIFVHISFPTLFTIILYSSQSFSNFPDSVASPSFYRFQASPLSDPLDFVSIFIPLKHYHQHQKLWQEFIFKNFKLSLGHKATKFGALSRAQQFLQSSQCNSNKVNVHFLTY